MPKGGNLAVKVSTYETEYELTLKPNATAKNLFDSIVATTGIREVWYFGLSFVDKSNQESWLKLQKKISKQVAKQDTLKFQFKFRYFPENVADEVIQDVTLRHLYKQVKRDIMTEKIYCPAEKAVLLASLAMQAKLGDFDASKHETGYLSDEKLLPQVILSQHKLSIQEWEEKICQFHKQHKMMSTDEAMLEYMKVAQDLEMYGINYYSVFNAKGTEALLGVDALGINFYDVKDKFNPNVSFPWSEVSKLSYGKGKLNIKFTDKKSPTQKVACKHPGTDEKIFLMATGNHDMYKRRRLPDPLDVQQMKAQKEEERRAREKERATLKKEMAAREKLEKAQQEAEAKFKQMEEDMETRRRELEESKDMIARLEAQLAETQRAREELEAQQDELKAMLEKLEKDHEMDLEERERLEEQIKAKQTEIDEVREKVEEKEEESRRMKEEMQQSGAAPILEAIVNGEDDKADEGSSSSESEAEKDDDQESLSSPEVPAIVVEQVDEDREPDPKTEELLKDLRADLSDTKVVGTETEEDSIYRDNLSQGRDKFKTLREVRKGNTKRRIDTFENM